jgi:hypothetical protein
MQTLSRGITVDQCLSNALEVDAKTIISAIDTLMVESGANANEAVLPAVVEFFSETNNLQKLIGLVDYAASAVESFIHPSGFDKLVLLTGENFKLRLHNFHPSDVQRPSENIHTHRWEFASSILYGYFVADFYELDENGEEERLHYQYHSETGMERKGAKTLAKYETRIHSKGSSYFLPCDLMHSIVDVAPTGAVSLIATGFTNGLTTEVFAKEELVTGSESASCGLGMFTADEIAEKLKTITSRL